MELGADTNVQGGDEVGRASNAKGIVLSHTVIFYTRRIISDSLPCPHCAVFGDVRCPMTNYTADLA